MASMFMKITGLDEITGGATLADVGGKKGLFAIDSLSWGGVRGVSIDVGNANNTDKGMVAMGEIAISRTSDGASPHLTTLLFAPGKDGKKVELIMTKPDRDGDTVVPHLIFELESCRMANYHVSCTDGNLPSESFSLIYTIISIAYYTEDDQGNIQKGDTIKFDVPTAKLVSKAG